MSLETDQVTVEKTEPIEAEVATLEITGMYTGAAIVVLGAFLPWYTFLGISVLGIEGDGLITLVLGFIAAGLVWYLTSLKRLAGASMALGSIITLVGLYHLTNISGVGVYLTVLGGSMLVGAGYSTYWFRVR